VEAQSFAFIQCQMVTFVVGIETVGAESYPITLGIAKADNPLAETPTTS
jgi:hypothetical protein